MCLFCDIINGTIPSSRVYEDDVCVAVLDIAQTTKGHTLVVPRAHFDNILECDSQTLHHLIEVTQKLASQIMEKLGAAGCNILVNTNEAAGQTIKHMHIHIIPRYDESDGITIEFTGGREKYELDAVLKEIIG